MTLLLLGKGAVLVRWLVRPLAGEMDEYEHRPIGDAADCSAWMGAVRPLQLLSRMQERDGRRSRGAAGRLLLVPSRRVPKGV